MSPPPPPSISSQSLGMRSSLISWPADHSFSVSVEGEGAGFGNLEIVVNGGRVTSHVHTVSKGGNRRRQDIGGKIDSWTWVETKCGIEWVMSHKMLILKAGMTFHPLLTAATRETRVGWPLRTIEIDVNGDSKSTNESGPFLVGSLGLSCQYKGFLFCLGCFSRTRTKYFFPHFLCPHRPASCQSCSVACLLVRVSGVFACWKWVDQQRCPSHTHKIWHRQFWNLHFLHMESLPSQESIPQRKIDFS